MGDPSHSGVPGSTLDGTSLRGLPGPMLIPGLASGALRSGQSNLGAVWGRVLGEGWARGPAALGQRSGSVDLLASRLWAK